MNNQLLKMAMDYFIDMAVKMASSIDGSTNVFF